MATKKSDISTGFDIEAELTKYELTQFLSSNWSGNDSVGTQVAKETTDAIWTDLFKQLDSGAKDLVDQAEEIFHEEAAMSHWSLNMADNSIDKYYSSNNSGSSIRIDARVGVNKNKIGDPKNWSTFIISKGKNKGNVGYYYKNTNYRMYAGRDYSVIANRSALYISGFCARAEERFDNL